MQHHVFPIKNRNLKLIRVINAYPKNFTLFLIKKKKRIIKRKIRFNAIIKSNFILNIFIFRIIFFNFLLQSFLSISLHISSMIKKKIYISKYKSIFFSLPIFQISLSIYIHIFSNSRLIHVEHFTSSLRSILQRIGKSFYTFLDPLYTNWNGLRVN